MEEMKAIIEQAKYERVRLDQMRPAPYNPRFDLQPGDINYERLKASLFNHGLMQPIIWNRRTGNIVGGHQRYKILVAEGIESVVCAVVDKDINDEVAANLALNKAHGRWDDELLQLMFASMDQEIDYLATGFDQSEVEHIITGLDQMQEEDLFDPQMEPEKGPALIKCPCCGKKFEERDNRV